MRVRELKFAAVVALVAVAVPAGLAFAGDDDPNGRPPDGTVEGTIPGGGGNPGDEDEPADEIGCPSLAQPFWYQATDEEVARARAEGELTDPEDLENEALMGGLNLWSYCDTNLGYRLWDYREQEGTPMIPFEDLIEKPDPQLHPENDSLVVGFPVWMTLENGGEQELDMPPAAGRFRAVPELVIWKTGIGNESVTCLDARNGTAVVADLEPPSGPTSEPPPGACVHTYYRPSTIENAGSDRAFEIVLEVTYRIEYIPPGASGWRVYPYDSVAVATSDPELVQVAELQAVAD